MLQLRPALPEHLPLINDIYAESIPAGLATADTEPISLAQRTEWYEQHVQTNRPVWILEEEQGTIVGWASLSDFYGRPAYRNTAEVSMYLSADQQGKGYGKAALQLLIDKAPESGIANLLGFIFAHNEPSLRLFRSKGFEQWACLPEIAHMPQGKRTLLILGKKL